MFKDPCNEMCKKQLNCTVIASDSTPEPKASILYPFSLGELSLARSLKNAVEKNRKKIDMEACELNCTK